jgi:integrase
MPRPVVFPPKLSEHKPSGQARVRWQGKDFYLGPWNSEESRQRYAALLLELTAASAHLAPSERSISAHLAPGLLVCDLIARWLRHARGYYSERGREAEQYALACRPLDRLFGATPAASFDADCLRRLQQALLDGTWMDARDRAAPNAPKQRGYCRRVVNARVKRVRTIWRWGEEAKLVPPGAWEALRAVKPVLSNRPGARDRPRARTTTLAEVKRVARGLTAVLRAMLLVQWWTGMRSGEVRAMCAGDVDAETRSYVPRQHKTDYLGHSRRVELGPRAWAVLRPWLALAAARGPDAPVFPSTRGGGHYTRTGYAHSVRVAALAAGLPHFRAYLCRGATRMRVSKSAGDEAARSVLGQKSLDVALSYGTLDESLAREAAARLG